MERAPMPDELAGLEVDVARETVRAALFPSIGRPRTIGPYVLRTKLGEGSLGLVFAARDPRSGGDVAIKILRSDVGVGAARDRLLREAKALGRVDSPHVVRVLDLGTEADRVYVVMELVHGMPLGDWLALGPELPRKLETLIGAARGLQAVHDAGLIHRDFKPDNVLVDDTGHARVVDFSLARDVNADSAASGSTWRVMTTPGTILGTPAYMAPEQFLGADSDPRTDQFAFCVCLYESLFGSRPFAGESMTELRTGVLRGTIEIPETPGWSTAVRGPLERLLRTGLARPRRDRFPDMSGVLVELEAALAAL